MPIVIKLAVSSNEVEDLLKVRYQVADQAGLNLNESARMAERLIDHYDVYPSTILLAVYQDGSVVGSVRAVEYSPDDSILNAAFDYKDSYLNLDQRSYLIDFAVFDPKTRFPDEAMKQCLSLVSLLLNRQKVQNLFFSCPESGFDAFKVHGQMALQEPVESAEFDEKIIPSRIDIGEHYSHFVESISDREIIRFQEVFYKVVFFPGEVLVVEGERGSTSYLIERGDVEVVKENEGQLLPIMTIGPGKLVGEIAMITNEPRTASIVAKDLTSCLAFDRADFMTLMYEQPHRSVDIFKIFSKRIQEANKRMTQGKDA